MCTEEASAAAPQAMPIAKGAAKSEDKIFKKSKNGRTCYLFLFAYLLKNIEALYL
jgi:hypothetical protein